MKRDRLAEAKKNKNDEFYTQLSDIEKEVMYYKNHFKNKTVYCNADDPRESNFFKYFSMNFEHLGLKKLISTCYKEGQSSVYLEYTGDKNGNKLPDDEEISVNKLKGDGDFRSDECIKFLKEADIIVSNPPFSLFREYVDQLVSYNKKFLIIGHQNAYGYRDIFKLIKDNKVWIGQSVKSGDMGFRVPESTKTFSNANVKLDDEGNKYLHVPGCRWFTNMDNKERYEDLILVKPYNKNDYVKYDNHDIINVDISKNIPNNYKGLMGVPITFIARWNPDQFDIIDILRDAKVNGKNKYYRLVVKNKKL